MDGSALVAVNGVARPKLTMTKIIHRMDGKTKAETNVMISATTRMIVAAILLSLNADSTWCLNPLVCSVLSLFI
jgi:hypothetical protein